MAGHAVYQDRVDVLFSDERELHHQRCAARQRGYHHVYGQHAYEPRSAGGRRVYPRVCCGGGHRRAVVVDAYRLGCGNNHLRGQVSAGRMEEKGAGAKGKARIYSADRGMHMKKSLAIFIITMLILLSGCKDSGVVNKTASPAQTDQIQLLTAADPRIKHLGRVYATGKTAYFAWTASGLEFRINGTDAEIRIKPIGASEAPLLKVFIDGAFEDTLKIETDQFYTVCENLPDGEHSIKIVKQNDASQGAVMLTELRIKGSIMDKPADSKRRIEFIGDSITVGMGNLGRTDIDGGKAANQDGMRTYAALTALSLNAEFSVIARSGCGVVRDASGYPDIIFDKMYYDYGSRFILHQWDFSVNIPDVVVINLGTNDYFGGVSGEEIEAGVRVLIEKIRENYPDAHIIWAYGLMTYGLWGNIQAAITELGDPRISFCSLPEQNADTVGAAGHPGLKAHNAAAQVLTAHIKAVMGW